MKTIQELQQELAKHRKLLHRAVGNQILPHINYHHYECVRIINEIQDSDMKRDRFSVIGVYEKNVKSLGDDFGKMFREHFLKLEDEAILKGNTPTQ